MKIGNRKEEGWEIIENGLIMELEEGGRIKNNRRKIGEEGKIWKELEIMREEIDWMGDVVNKIGREVEMEKGIKRIKNLGEWIIEGEMDFK